MSAKLDFLKTAAELVEQGKLSKATSLLEEFDEFHLLRKAELLQYFQLLRRCGAFHSALENLNKTPLVPPELEIERALLYGELGALKGAIKSLLRFEKFPDKVVETSRLFHLGNFYSLQHDYENMLQIFVKMHELTKYDPGIQPWIARLNIIGAQIYAGKKLERMIHELHKYISECSFPLMKQGAFYFLSLAYEQLGERGEALLALQNTQQLGVEHKSRETLLLKLTNFGLDPENKKWNPAALAKLNKEVMGQDHIVYFDQYNYLMGHYSLLKNKKQNARRYFLKSIFCQRKNLHARLAEKSLDEKLQDYWMLEDFKPTNINMLHMRRNRIKVFDLPVFKMNSETLAFSQESQLLQKITLTLVQRLEFGMNYVELWDQVWDQPFNPIESMNVVHQTLHRWRKSKFAAFAKIEVDDSRLHIRLKPRAKLYISKKTLSS